MQKTPGSYWARIAERGQDEGDGDGGGFEVRLATNLAWGFDGLGCWPGLGCLGMETVLYCRD